MGAVVNPVLGSSLRDVPTSPPRGAAKWPLFSIQSPFGALNAIETPKPPSTGVPSRKPSSLAKTIAHAQSAKNIVPPSGHDPTLPDDYLAKYTAYIHSTKNIASPRVVKEIVKAKNHQGKERQGQGVPKRRPQKSAGSL